MPRLLIILFLQIFAAAFSWSQEQEARADSLDETSASEPEPSSVDDQSADIDADDYDLDEQVYEDDDDDFVPTEEIPADEPIPFPSNI